MDGSIHNISKLSLSGIKELGSGTFSITLTIESYLHYDDGNDNRRVKREDITLFSSDKTLFEQLKIGGKINAHIKM